MISRAILAIFLCCATTVAHAQTYSWPADLTGTGFKCTLVAPGDYDCPAMSFPMDTYIVITSPIVVHVNGNFTAAKYFTIPKGQSLLLDVKGSVNFAKDMNGYLDIKSSGSMSFAKNTILYGDLNSGDNITIAKDSLIGGDVFTKNTLKVGKNSSISGDCSYTNTNYHCHKVTPPPTTAFDHFLIEHEGTGLTCTPSELTVWACGGASYGGTCPTTTDGATGKLQVKNAGGTVIASYDINIPAGQTNATIDIPYAGVETVFFATTAAGATCWDGDAASCQHVYNDLGFDFEVKHHVSATTQAIDIFAVSKSATGNTCVPAFSGTKRMAFSCAHVDPASAAPVAPGDERPVVIESGGASRELTCGATAQALDLNFDSGGKARINLNYGDVGKIHLAANYSAATMSGGSTFIAYPQKFDVSWPTPAATVVAGGDFTVKVTALNHANKPTPNYGREASRASAILSFIRCKPVNGDDGSASGTLAPFANGSAESSNSKWGEVGSIDIKASNPTYLGLAVNIEGSSDLDPDPAAGKCTGRFGRFRPSYFKTSLAPASRFVKADAARKWAYAGEPIGVLVSAFNAQDVLTANYNKEDDLEGGLSIGLVPDITFSATSVAPAPLLPNPGPGALGPAKILSKDLTDQAEGVVEGKTAYAFAAAALPVKPTTVAICAKDGDNVSSLNHCDAVLEIRTGRLRMSNAFGSVSKPAAMPVRVEYWTGSSWLLNFDDDTTTLQPPVFALSHGPSIKGVAVASAEVKMSDGKGMLLLSPPTRGQGSNGVGFVDIAVNLGALAKDNSCLAAHPDSAGASQSWLRSRNGSCDPSGTQDPAVIWSLDPTARANFGVTTRENQSTIHVRESFN
jgi:MSHA biogenesis protein MshQ